MRIIKIGKSHSNDIVIDSDSTVSREHLQIFIDEDKNVFVTDLNSMNGTFVNGNKIFESKKLGRFDILRIGNTLINWREYLDAEVDGTIADEPIDYNIKTVFENEEAYPDNNPKKKSRKRIYFGISVVVVLSLIAAYFYFTQDSKRICTTWKSKDNSGLSYTFFNDGTFEKDSNDIVKKGKYKIINGRNKKLKLTFSKKSLPVYHKRFISENTNKYPFPDEVDFEREHINSFGNIFNFKNNTDYDIKVLSLTQQTIKELEFNVNSKIYKSDNNFNNFTKRSTEFPDYSYSKYEHWDLVSDITSDISDNVIVHSDIDDLIIKKNDDISLMIITNDYVSISIGNSTDNSDLEISDSKQVQTYNDDFYSYNIYNKMWNGDIEYGIMNSKFELEYEFVGGNLELNGKLFKRK